MLYSWNNVTLWLWVNISHPVVLYQCFSANVLSAIAFSALTLLVGRRKGIWPVKTEWWGAGVFICLETCADLHMAQLMPLPLTVSCFSIIQTGFTFLVPAHLGSPEKGPLNGCVLSLSKIGYWWIIPSISTVLWVKQLSLLAIPW